MYKKQLQLKKFLIAGTGSHLNYGCEAIVRGTYKIIKENFEQAEITVASDNVIEDTKIFKDLPDLKFINIKKRFSPYRIMMGILRRLKLSDGSPVRMKVHLVKNYDVFLASGGDNYAQAPDGSIYHILKDLMKMGEIAKKNQKKYFIWGASIGPFNDKNLAGKNVQVTLRVKQILAPQTFALDDTFAKEFGHESFELLREKMKENLEKNYNNIAQLHLKRHLLDAMEQAYTFDLPASMVDSEFKVIWQHLQNEIQDVRENGDEYDAEGKSEDELKAEYTKIAERRVRLGLVISQISQKEKIQISQDDLRSAMMREAMRYPGQEVEVMDYYRKHPHLIDRIVAPILEDKVVDFILTKINLKDVTVTVPELKEKARGIVPFIEEDEKENHEEAPQKASDKTKKGKSK